jgi:phosphomannomutase
MDPKIFKAYDIRGVYPSELDEAAAENIARAFAAMRQQETGKQDVTILVGRDMRVSSPALTAAVIRGLTQQGADVVDIGLASTPTYYFGVAFFGYDGGMQISASHNPAQYNGLKIVRDQAKPVGNGTGMEELKAMVMDQKIPAPTRTGTVSERTDTLAEQLKEEMRHGDPGAVKPMVIVADAANAMGSQYLDQLFSQLPQVTVHRLFWDLDGTFPNHEADPFKAENITALQAAVRDKHADLGIATDGDGDRIFFVDNTGELIDPAIVRGILAQVFLAEKPGAKICYDIRPGRITRDMIEQAGGVPVVTKVGHSLIKAQALVEGAYFAGESSGHFFLNLPYGCFEMPMIMALKLLTAFSKSGQTVEEFVRPLRKYFHSGEINSKVADVPTVLEQIKEKYADGQVNLLDGVSVEYPDWWFNVRGSNTEPLIRLNLEARTQELMEQKRDEVLAVIRQ